MLPPKLAFVDIETTGLHASYDRIIEIAIIRVEHNTITNTYSSLINPQTAIPRNIEMITGIRAHELIHAPTFHEIKEIIFPLISDCVFVAHNVSFDYNFIKQELLRQKISYTAKQFCTVKLSRKLYPTYNHHNLDSIIKRFNFRCQKRHRALDDATILVEFYKKVQKEFSLERLAAVCNKIIQ